MENLFFKIMDSLSIDDKIAVAVSGGIDSMVLLNLISQYIKLKKKNNVVVLTVNHGLRSEAAQEVDFVVSQSMTLNLKCYALNYTGNKIKGNIQSKARAIRYNLLSNWCKDNDTKHLFLAHHKDDQVETILMRIERGSGIDGLVGIKGIVKVNEIIVYRPLLDFTRLELNRYAITRNITWIEDKSNENIAYKRVLYRHIIKNDHDSSILTKRICLIAKHAERALSAILHYVRVAIDLCMEISDLGYFNIRLCEFYKFPEEIACRIFMYSLMCISSNLYKPRYQKFISLFNKIWSQNFNGSQTFFGCKIVKTASNIFIYKEFQFISDRVVNLTLENEIIWDKRLVLKIDDNLKSEVVISKLGRNCFIPNHLKKYSKDVVHTLPVLKHRDRIIGYFAQDTDCVQKDFFIIKVMKVLLKQKLLILTYNEVVIPYCN